MVKNEFDEPVSDNVKLTPIHTYKDALVRLWGKTEDNERTFERFLEESRKDRSELHDSCSDFNNRISRLELLSEQFKEDISEYKKLEKSFTRLETRLYTIIGVISFLVIIGEFLIKLIQ